MFAVAILVMCSVLTIPYVVYLTLFQNTIQVKSMEDVAQAMIAHNSVVAEYCSKRAKAGRPCIQGEKWDSLDRGMFQEGLDLDVPQGLADSPFFRSRFIVSQYRESPSGAAAPDFHSYIITYLSPRGQGRYGENRGTIVHGLIHLAKDPFHGAYRLQWVLFKDIGKRLVGCVVGATSLGEKDLYSCSEALSAVVPTLKEGDPLIVRPLR